MKDGNNEDVKSITTGATFEYTPLCETPAEEAVTTQSDQTPIDQRTINDLLARAQRKIRRRTIWYWGSMPFFVVLLILYVFSWLYGWSGPYPFLRWLLPLSLATSFAVNLSTLFVPAEFDADELMRLGGKKAIPTLLDAIIGNVSQPYRKSCFRALIILLPQLQATDAHLLTTQHKHHLNTLIDPNPAANGWIIEGDHLVLVVRNVSSA